MTDPDLHAQTPARARATGTARRLPLVAAAAVAAALLTVPVSGPAASTAQEASSVDLAARAARTVVEAPQAVVTGSRFDVRGRIPTSQGARRKATVHYKSAGTSRWTLGASGRTDRRGKFALRLLAPTQAGPISVRFTAPRQGRVKAVKRTLTVSVTAPTSTPTATPTPVPTPTATPTAVPTATPTSTPTSVPTPTPTDEPTVEPTPTGPLGDPNDWTYIGDSMRWDACQTITWSYDATAQPYPGAEADMTTAFAMIAEKTGHSFTRVPLGEAVFTVDWSTPEEDPRLAGSVVGIGGPTTQRIDPVLNNGTQRAIVGGMVILDASHTGVPGGYGHSGWGQVMLHEIGHAVGLGHASGREQIMAPTSTIYNIVFGAGDLTGLTQVGTSKGCLVVDPYARAAQRPTTIMWAH